MAAGRAGYAGTECPPGGSSQRGSPLKAGRYFGKFIRTPRWVKTDDIRQVVYQPMKNKCSFAPGGFQHISHCLSGGVAANRDR